MSDKITSFNEKEMEYVKKHFHGIIHFHTQEQHDKMMIAVINQHAYKNQWTIEEREAFKQKLEFDNEH